MTKSICILRLMVLSSILTACATAQYEQPHEANSHSATIRITRPSAFLGIVVRAPIYVNNTYVGKISSGGELNWTVKPGPVTVSTAKGLINLNTKKPNFNKVSFNAQKGKTYYVTVTMPYQLEYAPPMLDDAGAFEVRMTNRS